MINIIVGFVFAGAVSIFLSAYFGQVTSLPFGLDEPIDFFMSTVNNLRNLMPWLNTLWEVFIIGLIVKIAIWTFDKILWFIQLVRGSGS